MLGLLVSSLRRRGLLVSSLRCRAVSLVSSSSPLPYLLPRSPPKVRWIYTAPCIIVPRSRAEVEKKDLANDPGVIEFKVVLCWAYSHPNAVMDSVGFGFYIHGLWPTIKGPIQSMIHVDSSGQEHILSQAMEAHKYDLLKYMPNMYGPNDWRLCRTFVRHEFTKHGENLKIHPLLFIELVLKVGRVIHQDFASFGITVGVLQKPYVVLHQVNEVMKKMKIDGVHIGHDVCPQISCESRCGIGLIKEVALVFQGIFGYQSAEFWLTDVRPRFKGDLPSELLLPSIDDIKELEAKGES